MAVIKKIVGQITLKVLVDVESITYFYLLMPSIAPVPSKPTTNPPIQYESEGYDGWDETEPGYVSGDTRSLYITIRTIYSDGSFEYTTPSLSSSYEAAKQAYNKATIVSNLVGDNPQHFWWLTTGDSTDVPAGAYITYVSKGSFRENPNNQPNLLLQSEGISLRNGLVTKAQMTGTGLKILEGGIVVGEYSSSASDTNQNFVYLSSENYGTGIQIGNSPAGKNDWRQIIGNKFGVDKAGNLYAAGGNISGAVTIGSTSVNQINQMADHVQIENGGIMLGNPNGFHIFIDGSSQPKEDYTYGLGFYEGPHNPYSKTYDTQIDVNKTYYTFNENSKSYEPVVNPSGNPSEKEPEWYEKIDKRVAYINNGELSIPYTVVLRGMRLGNKWVWELNKETDNLTLKWTGGE